MIAGVVSRVVILVITIEIRDFELRVPCTCTCPESGLTSLVRCACGCAMGCARPGGRREPRSTASARQPRRASREPREARRTRPSRRWPLQADPRTAHFHRAATLRATIHIAAYALCTLCTKFRVFTSRRAPALRSRARAAMPRARRRYRTRWVFPCRDPSFRRARCATQPAWPRQCS